MKRLKRNKWDNTCKIWKNIYAVAVGQTIEYSGGDTRKPEVWSLCLLMVQKIWPKLKVLGSKTDPQTVTVRQDKY